LLEQRWRVVSQTESPVPTACLLILVLELGSPVDGGVKVSGEPMRRAIVLLDR
jgi:hypothetical protein